MPAVIVALAVVFGSINPNFWSVTNMANVSRQVSTLALISIGQTFAILSAGIDLSVGSLLALVSVVCAQQMLRLGIAGGVIAGVVAGALAGLVNGLLIAKAKVPPFIATLGMLVAARGVALTLSGGLPIAGLPREFLVLGAGYWGPFPIPTIIAVVAFVARAPRSQPHAVRTVRLRDRQQRRGCRAVGHQRREVQDPRVCCQRAFRRHCGRRADVAGHLRAADARRSAGVVFDCRRRDRRRQDHRWRRRHPPDAHGCARARHPGQRPESDPGVVVRAEHRDRCDHRGRRLHRSGPRTPPLSGEHGRRRRNEAGEVEAWSAFCVTMMLGCGGGAQPITRADNGSAPPAARPRLTGRRRPAPQSDWRRRSRRPTIHGRQNPRGNTGSALSFRTCPIRTSSVRRTGTSTRRSNWARSVTLLEAGGYQYLDRQIAQVEDLIASRVDAIILVAVNGPGTVSVVDDAVAAGIPVINCNVMTDNDKVVTRIRSDDDVIGRMHGEFMGERLGGRGNVVMLRGAPGHVVGGASRERVQAEACGEIPEHQDRRRAGTRSRPRPMACA